MSIPRATAGRGPNPMGSALLPTARAALGRGVLPLAVPPGLRIIAHRGASAYAPENTLPAFQLALDMGVAEMELDVQLASDGVVVLCHDQTLDRYGHGPQTVESLPSCELLELDMGAWFSPHLFGGERMLTLEALFALFADRLTYHVEIKGRAPGLVAATVGLIQRHGLDERCVVTSFQRDALRAVHALAPHLRLGWLVDEIDELALAFAGELSLNQLCPRASFVNPTAVARGHAAVSEVRAWGLTGPAKDVVELIRTVVDSGCDGMTLNWPDWVVYRCEKR